MTWDVEVSQPTLHSDPEEELPEPAIKPGIVLGIRNSHSGIWAWPIGGSWDKDSFWDVSQIFNFPFVDPVKNPDVVYRFTCPFPMSYNDEANKAAYAFRDIIISVDKKTGKFAGYPAEVGVSTAFDKEFSHSEPWLQSGDKIRDLQISGLTSGNAAATSSVDSMSASLQTLTLNSADWSTWSNPSMMDLKILKAYRKAGFKLEG